MSVTPGETLGSYVIEQPLGRGGAGEVYLARGQRGEQVALKLLRPGAVDLDAASGERFEREGDMLQRLDHPNIVRLRGRGIDQGRPWIAMEYVPGRDLATLLRERSGNRLPASEALFVLEGCVRALEAAHAAGIIHRDVKPGNVLVTRDGKVKLTDFGIALSSDATSRLTARGEVVGTPTYVAPEVLRASEWGPPADMYAVGVLAYRVLTGQPAYPYKDLSQIIGAHLRETPPSLSAAVPTLAPAVADLFEGLLVKEPTRRLGATAFLAALQRAAHEEDTRRIPARLLEDARREVACPIHPPSGEYRALTAEDARRYQQEDQAVRRASSREVARPRGSSREQRPTSREARPASGEEPRSPTRAKVVTDRVAAAPPRPPAPPPSAPESRPSFLLIATVASFSLAIIAIVWKFLGN